MFSLRSADERRLTFTSDAVGVAELVAAATVTLVGAVHVGTLLTAGAALTLVHICTWAREPSAPPQTGYDTGMTMTLESATANSDRKWLPSQFLPSLASLKPVVQLHL